MGAGRVQDSMRPEVDLNSRGLEDPNLQSAILNLKFLHLARYPSGKGEVCKTFMRRFESGPRLKILQIVNLRL